MEIGNLFFILWLFINRFAGDFIRLVICYVLFLQLEKYNISFHYSQVWKCITKYVLVSFVVAHNRIVVTCEENYDNSPALSLSG